MPSRLVRISQLSRLSVQQSTSVLSALASTCFAWPREVTDAKRHTLKLEAVSALIKTSIVRSAIEFSAQNTLVIPPLLAGRHDYLRRLALDLDTAPRDGMYYRELDGATKIIPTLREQFPEPRSLRAVALISLPRQDRCRHPPATLPSRSN